MELVADALELPPHIHLGGVEVDVCPLARSLRAGMIVVLDRVFSSNAFLEKVAGTGAELLARLTASRKPPVLRRLPDGTFVSRLGTLQMRIIECEITIDTAAGRHTGVYRLATTLLDPRRHPAFELVKLYHERGEVESAYFAINKTMLGRRVLLTSDLGARLPPGVRVHVFHGLQDETAPPSHADLHALAIPQAQVRQLPKRA